MFPISYCNKYININKIKQKVKWKKTQGDMKKKKNKKAQSLGFVRVVFFTSFLKEKKMEHKHKWFTLENNKMKGINLFCCQWGKVHLTHNWGFRQIVNYILRYEHDKKERKWNEKNDGRERRLQRQTMLGLGQRWQRMGMEVDCSSISTNRK